MRLLDRVTPGRISFPGLSLLMIMLCLLMAPGFAVAHLPSLFGKEYIRAEPSLPSEPGTEATPLEIEAGDPTPYEEQLADVALRDGPYASGLTDPLAGVAQIYKQRGDYDDAIEAYRRALHLIRVNDGLKSERQIPLLRDLMEIYRIKGDGKALDDAYHYYFNVHGNGHPPYSDASIAASLEYMAWQREAFGVGIGGKTRSRARAVQAYLRNGEIIEAMNAQPAINQAWYEQVVLSQMANLYLILGEELEDNPAIGMPSGEMYGAELRSEHYVRDRIAVIQQSGEKLGRRLLEGLIERADAASETQRAGYYLELGDWSQWNGSLRRANEAYTIAESILRAESEDELLLQWFSEPMELPDERRLWRSSHGLSREQHPVLTARYDVNEKGDVRNVVISRDDDPEPPQAGRLKRLLRDTHFRPQFSRGQPVPATGLERYYQIID